MNGIKFLFDDKGNEAAVLIDLKKHAALWEDFYDALIAKQRAKEPTVPWEVVRKRLVKAGKIRGSV